MKGIHTLNENRDFCRLYKRGRNGACPLLVAYVSPNRLGINRMGVTVSKKVGNAVVRNRARRLLREGYRLLYPVLPQGFDIVLVARGRTPTAGMEAVKAAMERLLPVLMQKQNPKILTQGKTKA